ncbi:MAG: hypothetical protein GY879_07950 [Planctomycetes bacterium]|nr:hypothetical protein [Planctomycetota bacterium]MCP4860437.1 hypothetical protein [Planctomycetota bacterium]
MTPSADAHLVLAPYGGGALGVIDRLKERVFLADGLDSKNRLSEDTLERAMQCLRQFRQRLEGWPKPHIPWRSSHLDWRDGRLSLAAFKPFRWSPASRYLARPTRPTRFQTPSWRLSVAELRSSWVLA